jgi:hypothetical protein
MAEPTAASDTATQSEADGPPKLPLWRRILVSVLVVLVCVLAPISVLGVWVRNTLLHTDQYVSTMAPLADNPAVQKAIANRITNTLIENTDLEQKITDKLPRRAAALAPLITGGAQTVVHDATLKIVESDQFATLWDQLNRRAHSRVVALLQGKGTDTVDTKNGEVVVHIGPVVKKVAQRLGDTLGIDFFKNITGERVDKTVVLFSSEDLRQAQGAVDLLNTVGNVLPFVLLALLAVAIWLSGNRRRTILRTALGIALGMGLMLVVFNLGRTIYLDVLPRTVNQDSAGAVYDQLLSFLRTALRTAFVLAIVVAIGAWLVGPGGIATRIRTGLRDAIRREPEPGEEPSGVGAFVGRYRNVLRVIVVAIGFVVLVVIDHPTPVSVLVVAVLVLIGLLIVELLGRKVPSTGPAT